MKPRRRGNCPGIQLEVGRSNKSPISCPGTFGLGRCRSGREPPVWLPWIRRSTCSASDLALIPATAPWVFPHANRGYASAACALSVLRFTALHHFFSIYNILFSRPDPAGLVKPRLHGNNLELQPFAVLFGKGAFVMNERAGVAAPSTAANNSVQMDTFLVARGLVVAHRRAVLLALALACRRRLMAGRP